ncbi:MAG: hypothetical protein QM802_03550 [Agriterribacter sp.]
MCALKNMLLLMLMIAMQVEVKGQKSKVPSNVINIFDDLPVDDAAARSVLLENDNAEKKIIDNIFIKAVISKQQCFEGEPLLLKYELYTCLQSTSELIKQPGLEGFTVHSMPVNNEVVRYKQVNGKQYRMYDLAQFQLFAYRTGQLNIEPPVVNNTVVYADGGGREKKYSGIVNGANIEVMAAGLPSITKSSAFVGGVGRFTISTYVQKEKFCAGENNVLFVEIEGVGNFENIHLPELFWPKGFEHFEVTSDEKVDYTVFPAAGKRVYAIPFVAKEAGNIHLPEISFMYFDISKNNYNEVKSLPLSLAITPTVNVEKHEDLPEKHWNVFNMLLYLFILLVGLGIGATVIIFKRSKRNIQTDLPREDESMLQRSEIEIASSDIIKAIEDAEQNHSGADCIEEVKNILLWYEKEVGDGNSLQHINPVVPATDSIHRLIEECDRLLYSPSVIDEVACRTFIKETTASINRMNMHSV